MKTISPYVRILAVTIAIVLSSSLVFAQDEGSTSYGKGFRKEQNGWIYLHIEGAAKNRGEQMGYLMAREIDGYFKLLKASIESRQSGYDWKAYREATEKIIMPKVVKEWEYLYELKGIVSGLSNAGIAGYDLTDIMALNANMEIDTYFDSLEPSGAWHGGILRRPQKKRERSRCSAFIATGSATKDGKIVLAHNTWDSYVFCQPDNIILDIKPVRGARILMQGGAPGLIHSGTDFAITSYGLMISETTIADARGFNVNGIPEFIRMRKATQYAKTIDDFYRIMRTGNNGGYACSWLVGDTGTNEIAKIELTCNNVAFSRSMDGYYDGQNYVDDAKMIREDCSYTEDGKIKTRWDVSDNGFWPYSFKCENSSSFRRMRIFAILDQNKGLIDANVAKSFLADQINPLTNLFEPGPKTIMSRWEIYAPEPAPVGAYDGMTATSEMTKTMTFWARFGHPDGSTFTWDDAFFNANPEYKWQQPFLRDLENNPWTLFSAAAKE